MRTIDLKTRKHRYPTHLLRRKAHAILQAIPGDAVFNLVNAVAERQPIASKPPLRWTGGSLDDIIFVPAGRPLSTMEFPSLSNHEMDPNQLSIRGPIPTDAGMHCVWSPEAFADVDDYESWEPELCEDEDISRHISAGDFVPINLGRDAVLEIEVRATTVGPVVLSDRERQYLYITSEPYRFLSRGAAAVGGIEHVRGTVSSPALSMKLPAGEWAVVIHLLDWSKEPGAFASSGKPAKTALPDFLVTLSPATHGQLFRTALRTFTRPGSAR